MHVKCPDTTISISVHNSVYEYYATVKVRYVHSASEKPTFLGIHF